MSVTDFTRSVEDGVKLSKRIYFGKDRSVAPPNPSLPMSRSPKSYLPTAPMLYAVISDPGIVDNPDIPSYQPHVFGRCDPPALIPLQMNSVDLQVDCFLDTAFVRVSGSWRVHCVMGSKSCDCRLAVPMGEQGSIIGVEVDIPRKIYRSQLVSMKEEESKSFGADDGGYLKPELFMLTIPHIDGGTNLAITITWSQKLVYQDGDFSLSIPFSFPEYVTPAGKKIPKKEKIQLCVNSGNGAELLCRACSHPLKERRRQVGNMSFLYEADVLSWSSVDFSFCYNVPTSHLFGSVILESPTPDDVDQREMFSVHILPGNQQKVFTRSIVFAVDVSRSMQGKLLDDAKNALSSALSHLRPKDSFNILAFSEETSQFSSSLKPATQETIEDAIKWMGTNFVVGDGTNILHALNQSLDVLSNIQDSLPLIFLITDGSVENERTICNTIKSRLSNCKSIGPRIHTFGIGAYCNHHFLRMLAMIGRGHYEAAYDPDMIEFRFGKLFNKAASTVLADITIDGLNELHDLEVYPVSIQDLSSQCPLIFSGRYRGNFPEAPKARGIVANKKNFSIDLRVEKANDIPLNKIVAMHQITTSTALAWLLQERQLEEKVAKMSMQIGIVSEYTCMTILETTKEASDSGQQKKSKADKHKEQCVAREVRSLGLGFGNLKATENNLRPGFEEAKPPEAAEIFIKGTSDCCTKLFGCCCCMCCIECCNKVNNQCAIVLAQFCTAFACFGCLECCTEVCCSGGD
ncbi:hypothetical protein V2J09_017733 [Rumex salicifolius]